MDALAPELRDHEPRMALTDEQDGLSAYRLIASQAQGYLTAQGRVLVEIGWQQGAAVQEIFEQAGWAKVEVAPDLGGRPRVICAAKPA
jgi:release factor glutamine methyltransferase